MNNREKKNNQWHKNEIMKSNEANNGKTMKNAEQNGKTMKNNEKRGKQRKPQWKKQWK